MTKNCANQQPTAYVRVHTPETLPIHPHRDATFTVKKETDYEVWSEVCQKLMASMGIVHAPLVIGFLLDFLNTLPIELRRILASGIVLGLGCKVTEEKDGAVRVEQRQRYEPLMLPSEGRHARLVVPTRPKLVLPQ